MEGGKSHAHDAKSDKRKRKRKRKSRTSLERVRTPDDTSSLTRRPGQTLEGRDEWEVKMSQMKDDWMTTVYDERGRPLPRGAPDSDIDEQILLLDQWSSHMTSCWRSKMSEFPEGTKFEVRALSPKTLLRM